ncbi:MAG: hypothetical protein LBQ27_04600 [Clostridiales bacterium]|jgi:signal recognition particle GTPase|nr:hypothetical protein [Clostridiales bacterium]
MDPMTMINLFSEMTKNKPTVSNDAPSGLPAQNGLLKIIESMDKNGSMSGMMGLLNMLPNMAKPKNDNQTSNNQEQKNQGGNMKNTDYEAYNTARNKNIYAASNEIPKERVRRRAPFSGQNFDNLNTIHKEYFDTDISRRSAAEEAPPQKNPDGSVRNEELQYINTAPIYRSPRKRNNINYKKE